MIGEKIGVLGTKIRYGIARFFSLLKVNPSVLTFIGLVINIYAAFLFASGRIRVAGIIVLIAGIFDMVDGTLARISGMVSRFGSFFDSVIDRYSDFILFSGIIVLYARVGRIDNLILTSFALMGAMITSYAKARAENLIESCKVGFMERPERIVILILGAVSNHLLVALWILAVGTNITAFHRIYHTWRETERV
ncbi:MAG: CDP-alcohol phosphatidyltransferase family protein [Acidobacteria bacterium]|nr:CDP-alcohol phosphatidyltransferase family protein [Acidobacteriota bacterium]